MFDTRIRILVVDDMTSMRKLLIKMLKNLGFSDFTEAKDGAIGWQKITHAEPPIDLIISDLTMPKCSGLDLLRRVRSNSRFKNLPFMIMLIGAEQSKEQEAIKAGANQCLKKPLRGAALKAQLEDIFTHPDNS